jgi:hypothetical protein
MERLNTRAPAPLLRLAECTCRDLAEPFYRVHKINSTNTEKTNTSTPQLNYNTRQPRSPLTLNFWWVNRGERKKPIFYLIYKFFWIYIHLGHGINLAQLHKIPTSA